MVSGAGVPGEDLTTPKELGKWLDPGLCVIHYAWSSRLQTAVSGSAGGRQQQQQFIQQQQSVGVLRGSLPIQLSSQNGHVDC